MFWFIKKIELWVSVKVFCLVTSKVIAQLWLDQEKKLTVDMVRTIIHYVWISPPINTRYKSDTTINLVISRATEAAKNWEPITIKKLIYKLCAYHLTSTWVEIWERELQFLEEEIEQNIK